MQPPQMWHLPRPSGVPSRRREASQTGESGGFQRAVSMLSFNVNKSMVPGEAARTGMLNKLDGIFSFLDGDDAVDFMLLQEVGVVDDVVPPGVARACTENGRAAQIQGRRVWRLWSRAPGT